MRFILRAKNLYSRTNNYKKMEITLDPNELENLTRIITELEEIELQVID